MSKAARKLQEIVSWFPDKFTTRWGRRDVPGVGEYYPERFNEETQELMKELKSDDLKSVPIYMVDESPQERGRRELSEAKLKFDKEMFGK